MRKERKERVKRKKKKKRNEIRKKEKTINLFMLINKQTHRQTDRRTDRHKSFIDMRHYTEQYSKSNSTKENRIQSNQIESIWNKVQ